MIRALLHSVEQFVESTGGWSILALDGLLLIPLLFAVFFFPMAILIGVGATGVVAAVALVVRRAVQSHHPPRGTL